MRTSSCVSVELLIIIVVSLHERKRRNYMKMMVEVEEKCRWISTERQIGTTVSFLCVCIQLLDK